MNDKYLKAKDYYLNNEISLTKLSKMFNIDRGNFTSFLKKEGIEIINKQNAQTIFEDYFEIINTEEKAYWLGFLFADGNVSKNSNNIEISLKPSDIKHLEKFAKAINYTNKIIINDTRCRICFANKKMKQDLIKQGCIPAKSLILKRPKLEEWLIRHFIRGYFDGDGCITFNQKRHHRASFSVLGTEDMLNYISTFLTGSTKKLASNRGSNDVMILSYSGQTSRNALIKLYEEATIYLDRKFERYNLMKIALQDENVLNALSKYGESPVKDSPVVTNIIAKGILEP